MSPFQGRWRLFTNLDFYRILNTLIRGPHFASKVSYNAGAATDDYTGQCKPPHFPNLYFSLPQKTKKSGYAHVGAWRSRIFYDCFSKRALRCVGNGKSGGLSVGDE